MKLINDNHGDEMKEYTITIQEIMRKSINIEAENEEQAKQLIQSKYSSGELVLYPEECDIETNIEVNEKIP
ncbi:hypothetical protein B5G32_02485 [Massilimicrobiota sp. An80]|jgi:hypothetical protein|nr:hypothetical protein B5G32_02485 [Massilimicrobiota sp. An80]